jgi:hypothetical protein
MRLEAIEVGRNRESVEWGRQFNYETALEDWLRRTDESKDGDRTAGTVESETRRIDDGHNGLTDSGQRALDNGQRTTDNGQRTIWCYRRNCHSGWMGHCRARRAVPLRPPFSPLANGATPLANSVDMLNGATPLTNFLKLQRRSPIAPFTNTSQVLRCNNKYMKVTKNQENFKNHIVVIWLRVLAWFN